MLPKLLRTNHKVLIFSQFTQTLDFMRMYFNYRNIAHLMLDGRCKDEDRKISLNQFSDPNSPEKVFILSTKAGGHGLNLQVADTVIIFDSDWNPQMDEQAKDRAHRIGQQSEVRIFRLITSTKVEEGILSRANYKKGIENKIIKVGGFDGKTSDMERQKQLEELIRGADDDDRSDNGESEIPTFEMLNEMLARSPEEIELFNKMDEETGKREGKEQRMKEIMAHRPGITMESNVNWRLI